MNASGLAATTPSDHAGETLKRLRKGTKSCIECRQRKIRCVWNAPGDAVCAGCQARGHNCVPQIYQRRSVNPDRLTSRDRIHRLEQQLANITAAVHDNNNNGRRSTTSLSPTDGHLGEAASPEEDPESGFDSTDGPASTPPAHLRFLFDSSLIGSQHYRDEDSHTRLSQARCSTRHLDQARAKFQRLIPASEDVLAVANYATPWMSIYMALFPATTAIGSKDELISGYDKITVPDAHPVSIAAFLLVFALTALQAKTEVRVKEWKDATTYATELGHIIETTIVSHTGLATTLEGIETIVMYLRLLLAVGSVRNLWLTLRRAIALAELMGLPKASYLSNSQYELEMMTPYTQSSGARNPTTQRVAIWEAICSTDRLSSMMFNLPAATMHHDFPEKEIISPEGDVMPRPYMFHLAGFAMKVQTLDEGYTLGQPSEELYEKVLVADRKLRALKKKTPKNWWIEKPDSLSVGYLVQFWHYYLTARIHLHSAMNYEDEHDQYAYSRMTCTDACEEMARRYAHLRPMLPNGFFICRIIDMQVFTASTYLLLSCLKQGLQPDQQRQDLIQRVLETMDLIPDPLGAAFVRDGSAAIRSLVSLVQNGRIAAGPHSLTLRIPLLGKVRIGRKEHPDVKDIYESAQRTSMPQSLPQGDIHIPADGPYPQPPSQQPPPPFDSQMASMMPWLMELDMGIPALNDSLLLDDYPEFDQWALNNAGFAT